MGEKNCVFMNLWKTLYSHYLFFPLCFIAALYSFKCLMLLCYFIVDPTIAAQELKAFTIMSTPTNSKVAKCKSHNLLHSVMNRSKYIKILLH